MTEIIVALDKMDKRRIFELARTLTGKVWGFKINDVLLGEGTSIINSLKIFGHVFADPKLHDIPNTVRNSVKRLSDAGADFITVHVSGGVQMLQAAVEASGSSKIIGVTLLTSLSFDEVRQTYRGFPLERFSDIVKASKIHGVVCSNKEFPFWNLFNLIKIVPGIRPFGPVAEDDQIRSCQISKADYIVVGRPLVTADDPLLALQKIKDLLS